MMSQELGKAGVKLLTFHSENTTLKTGQRWWLSEEMGIRRGRAHAYTIKHASHARRKHRTARVTLALTDLGPHCHSRRWRSSLHSVYVICCFAVYCL